MTTHPSLFHNIMKTDLLSVIKEQNTEIIRLKALVKTAYNEAEMELSDWNGSDAKKELNK